ncbi:MAG: M23 family metallopeptidase [Bacteroidales bacterium]|nr:M23 family metallopeptidase [Bacteroidales bacterium]
MRPKLFIFNKKSGSFIERSRLSALLEAVGRHLAGGIFFALLFYVAFTFLYSNRTEKALEAENSYLQEYYNNLLERSQLVDDVLDGLEARDNQIYHNIFNVDPPSTEGLLGSGAEEEMELEAFLNSSEEELIASSGEALDNLSHTAAQIDRQIRAINDRLADESFKKDNFPSVIPLNDFAIARTGATTGKKVNPFFKTISTHTGIDLMAPYGTEVMATGSGTVVEVLHQGKGLGNMVTIDHGGDLRTTYAHLSDVYVAINQKVTRGKVIGRVGNSGQSFSTALHYEVRKRGRAVDPVNYFFGSLSPSAYSDMLILANTTGQSLD